MSYPLICYTDSLIWYCLTNLLIVILLNRYLMIRLGAIISRYVPINIQRQV